MIYKNQNKDCARWISYNRHNPGLIQWLANNPPPKDWQGTKYEWAYLEMPIWHLSDVAKVV